jgi:hypothetical protein
MSDREEIKINFRTVVTSAIGTTRECNDGSGEDCFTISSNEVEGISDNLTTWWDEKYPEVECTLEYALEYFDEIYPELD